MKLRKIEGGRPLDMVAYQGGDVRVIALPEKDNHVLIFAEPKMVDDFKVWFEWEFGEGRWADIKENDSRLVELKKLSEEELFGYYEIIERCTDPLAEDQAWGLSWRLRAFPLWLNMAAIEEMLMLFFEFMDAISFGSYSSEDGSEDD